MTKQYFRHVQERFGDIVLYTSADFDLEAGIALRLIESFGAIAGKEGQPVGEQQRPTLALQSPEELVERCFTIARLFVERCEQEGRINVLPAPELKAKSA